MLTTGHLYIMILDIFLYSQLQSVVCPRIVTPRNYSIYANLMLTSILKKSSLANSIEI